MVSLLDGVKLGVLGTVFTFGVCSSGNGGMKGRGLLCIGSVCGKLTPGVETGSQYIPRGF